MLRQQGYKFRLEDPTGEQLRRMVQFVGEGRWLWNLFVTNAKERRARGDELLTYGQMAKALTALRAMSKLSWLQEGSSAAQQRVLRNLRIAWQRYFEGVSKEPAFHKKGRHDSYGWSGRQHCRLDQQKRRVWVPKLGWLRYRGKRPVFGELTGVVLRRKGLHWYVTFQCEREVDAPVLQSTRRRVGIDLGIAVHTATSDGKLLAGPNALKRGAKKLAKEQRKQSRRQKGSKRRKKQAIKVAHLHERIANVRRDHLHKLTTKLAKNHGLVAIENLQVANMSKSAKGTVERPGKHVSAKRSLNRRVLDQGWGEFRRQLAYKTQWYGSRLVLVPAANTSRQCWRCKKIAKENRTSQSRFCCIFCGFRAHADTNAAKNTLEGGWKIFSSGR